MKLIEVNTKEEFEAEIIEVDSVDLKEIKKSKRFEFNWNEEKTKHLFKIVAKDQENAQILGLISLIDITTELRIHINLLEVSKENIGKTKEIDKIAGCLIHCKLNSYSFLPAIF